MKSFRTMSRRTKIILGISIAVVIALIIVLPIVLTIDPPHTSSSIDYSVVAYQDIEYPQSSMSVRKGKHRAEMHTKDGKVSILHPNTESILKAHRNSDTKGLF